MHRHANREHLDMANTLVARIFGKSLEDSRSARPVCYPTRALHRGSCCEGVMKHVLSGRLGPRALLPTWTRSALGFGRGVCHRHLLPDRRGVRMPERDPLARAPRLVLEPLAAHRRGVGARAAGVLLADPAGCGCSRASSASGPGLAHPTARDPCHARCRHPPQGPPPGQSERGATDDGAPRLHRIARAPTSPGLRRAAPVPHRRARVEPDEGTLCSGKKTVRRS